MREQFPITRKGSTELQRCAERKSRAIRRRPAAAGFFLESGVEGASNLPKPTGPSSRRPLTLALSSLSPAQSRQVALGPCRPPSCSQLRKWAIFPSRCARCPVTAGPTSTGCEQPGASGRLQNASPQLLAAIATTNGRRAGQRERLHTATTFVETGVLPDESVLISSASCYVPPSSHVSYCGPLLYYPASHTCCLSANRTRATLPSPPGVRLLLYAPSGSRRSPAYY